MEKSDNVYVYPANFGWSDLGTWGSVSNHIKLDENSNAIQAEKILLYDSADNIINIPHNRLLVMQGMNGYIVVENDGILLICKKENEQEIKRFVADVGKME